jgi:hypothetical protein
MHATKHNSERQDVRVEEIINRIEKFAYELKQDFCGSALVLQTSPVQELFLCPISQKIMQDPVMLVDGQTYERANIERWFGMGRNTSPVSGLRLASKTAIPNIRLRNTIQAYLQEQAQQSPPRPDVQNAHATGKVLGSSNCLTEAEFIAKLVRHLANKGFKQVSASHDS